jgi:transcriptional regulator with XRE-family HTH domain
MATLSEISADLDKLDGALLIHTLLAKGAWHQQDLAKASGLAPDTITKLKNGKKPTNAQRAALKWALATRTADCR